jgi:DNA-directed RNA polymerase specialized sigma24 family protein
MKARFLCFFLESRFPPFSSKSDNPVTENQSIPWQSLLEAAKRGDQNRQQELIEALNVRLRVFIQYNCWGWSTEDQEDVLQETLEVFWEKIHSIANHPEKFAARILRNKIGDELRKRLGRRDIMVTDNDDPSSSPKAPLDEWTLIDESHNIEARIEEQELLGRFASAIKRLSPFCKTLFMGLLEGKNINDMWEFFSSLNPRLSRSAFDTRNTRCRQKLIEELNKLSMRERGK